MPREARPKNEAPPFGRRLAALRKRAGLNQTQFGEQAGITRAMVDYYERRATKPASDFIVKAATILDCTADDLLGLSDSKTAKRGPKSKLDRYVEQVKALPKSDQQYVARFLEQMLQGREKG